MYQLILIFHVLLAVCLIGLVLLQQGKGAGMGTAFGSGASQTVFGSRGSGAFLLKLTALLAALFFGTSLTLGYLATKSAKAQNQLHVPAPVKQPARPLAPKTSNK